MAVHHITGTVEPIDPLDPTTERELILLWQETGSVSALETVIRASARWIARRAQRLSGDDCPAEDLFQAGVVGLIEALAAYPTDAVADIRGYASRYVSGAMSETIAAYARGYTVPARTRRKHRDAELNGRDAGTDVETLTTNAADAVADVLNRDTVRSLLPLLDARERQVVQLVFGLGCRPHSDQEAALMLRMSRSRAAEVRLEAVTKMRAATTDRHALVG